MVRRHYVLALLLLLGLALLCPVVPAAANGGTLQLSRRPVGPYEITVYTSPTPLRAGRADVSAALEWADSGDLEPDARVLVLAEPLGHEGQGGLYEASHEGASDPAFYAADVPLTAGRWRLEIEVISRTAEGAVSFEVEVLPRLVPMETRTLTILLVAGVLITIAWLVVRQRRLRRQSAGPELH